MSLRRDGKLIIVPMKEYLQEATEKEKSKKEKRKTQSIPKVEDVLAARFATEKEIAQQRLELLDQYHTWYQNNVSYIANPVTKQALDAVESLTSRAATQAEIDQAAAAINKLSTLSLGVEDALETSSYKVIFLGKDAANAQADDFYRANERRTIPREWVPSRLPKDVSLIMNTRGEVTGLMLGKGASELKVQQVINAIIKRSGLKVRMGAHELGITSIGQRRYREGNLHIHFESTAPNESGIYYNFRLSIQAGKLTKKASLPQLRHMYLRFFGPYLDTADIEWPSDSQPDLYSMNRTLNDGLFAQQFA